MFQKIVLFSALVLTASCMIQQSPTLLRIEDLEPNYNFAYEVNDAKTGDVKSQSESRKGDVVFGQYALVQPDGIRRVVEYRADDVSGFTAYINNENTRRSEKEESQAAVSPPAPEMNRDGNKQFNEQQVPATQNLVSRSHVIKSVPNSAEPFMSTILHN